jgi:predicted ester cyclase
MKTAVAFVLLLCAPAWATIAPTPARSVPTQASQQELNKAVARRVFEEIFNQGKFQVADEIYAPDFVNHGLHRDASLQEDQDAARWEKQICPDVKMTIGPMVAEGDLVSVRWIFRGTNTVSTGWLPATGAKIEVRGITIWRIVDGRIHDEWTAFDMLRVVRQVVDQLKWQLLGLLCVALILLWLVGRGLRKLWRICWTAKG